MHPPTALILTTYDQLFATGKQQLARHRIDTIIGRRDDHRLTGDKAVRVAEGLIWERGRRRLARHLQGLLGRHFTRCAMPERHDPGEPGGHCRIGIHQRRGHRRRLEEPQWMGHGDIGNGRLAEQEVALLVPQLLFQPRHEYRPLVLGDLQRNLRSRAAAEQAGAVDHEALDLLRGQAGKTHGHGLRLEHQADRMAEHHRVGPGGKSRRDHFPALGEQPRGGLFLLQAASDQGGVTVDIGTDLQHRGFPVATGQRGQIGFWHDRRDMYRAPGQALETQQQAGLFGKGRRRVVVKNQLRHAGVRRANKNPQLSLQIVSSLPSQPDALSSTVSIARESKGSVAA